MKNENEKNLIPISMVRDAQNELAIALEQDPKYSLEVDPEGKLGLTEIQKRFIECYIESRSLPYAAQLAGITEEEAREIYFDPTCKSERTRINRVLNYRRFTRRLLTVDEVGGYLTSMLMDEEVGMGERLTPSDKLRVTKQILDINKMKAEAYNNPRIFDNVEFIETDTKDMTPEELKRIIAQTKQGSAGIQEEKTDLINKINKNREFDSDDLAHFWECSVSDLKQILEEKEKAENANQNLSPEN